jgi:hypothetical protein
LLLHRIDPRNPTDRLLEIDRLGPLGEDGRSLMQDAPVAWLKRAEREGKFGTEVLGRVAQLLDD